MRMRTNTNQIIISDDMITLFTFMLNDFIMVVVSLSHVWGKSQVVVIGCWQASFESFDK